MSKNGKTFDKFFWSELDSPEKFYYLGFMIGDGNVYKNSVKVELSVRDYQWLVNYKNNTTIDTRISVRNQFPARNSICASVVKSSVQWAKDLSEYNFVPHKTGIETLPLDYCEHSEDAAALVLGILDADGSIYESTNNRTNLNFVGNKAIVEQVNAAIEEYTGVISNKIQQDKRTDNIYTTTFGAKNDLLKIYDWLYTSNPELKKAWLVRKHDRWATFVLNNYNRYNSVCGMGYINTCLGGEACGV